MMDVVEGDAAVTRVTRSHRQVEHVADNHHSAGSGSNSSRLRFTFNGVDNKGDAVDRSSNRNRQSIEDNQSSDEEHESARLAIRFPSKSHNTRNNKRLSTGSKPVSKATSISTRRPKSRVNYAEVHSDEDSSNDDEEAEEEVEEVVEADEEEETQQRPNRRRIQAVAGNSNTSTSDDSSEDSPDEEQDGSDGSDENREEVAPNRKESRSQKTIRTTISDNSNEDEDDAPRHGKRVSL